MIIELSSRGKFLIVSLHFFGLCFEIIFQGLEIRKSKDKDMEIKSVISKTCFTTKKKQA